MLKKSIFCQKIRKKYGIFLYLGQLKKMQKSAKSLISFFGYLHMLSLSGKKIGSGKVRHLEKFTVI
jgi:hypothetical protein